MLKARTYPYEVRIRTAKNGAQRATYYSRPCDRWMPIPLSEALAMIADGTAVESKSFKELWAEQRAASERADNVIAAARAFASIAWSQAAEA